MGKHSERAHSKYSASGAERWFECAGSVELSEGIPDKPSKWAEEGTRAHELLEKFLKMLISGGFIVRPRSTPDYPEEMILYAEKTARFIYDLYKRTPGSEILVETKIYLDFINPAMFGTFDGAVIDHFGTLHVFDFKYGAGVTVSPRSNLQMIFYALGLAYLHHWNFKKVRVWIDQPRIRGYDGPVYWELSTMALKPWADIFRKRVLYVEKNPNEFKEGAWCHWCRAKGVCPPKRAAKVAKAAEVFSR